MRLTDLEPRFIRYEDRIETYNVVDGDPATWEERGKPTKEETGPRTYLVTAEVLDQAQGIYFLCPQCFKANGGAVGTHLCEVTFEGRGALDHQGTHNSKGQPVRWHVSGSGFGDLSTSPSILLEGGCGWHGYITKGDAT